MNRLQRAQLTYMYVVHNGANARSRADLTSAKEPERADERLGARRLMSTRRSTAKRRIIDGPGQGHPRVLKGAAKPPFPDSAGNGKRGPDRPQIEKSGVPRRASTAGTILCQWAGCCLECPKCRFVMSDKQTIMSNDTLERAVCLRTGSGNSRMAVAAPKKIDVDDLGDDIGTTERGQPEAAWQRGQPEVTDRIKLSGALGGLSVSGLIVQSSGYSLPAHWHINGQWPGGPLSGTRLA